MFTGIAILIKLLKQLVTKTKQRSMLPTEKRETRNSFFKNIAFPYFKWYIKLLEMLKQRYLNY